MIKSLLLLLLQQQRKLIAKSAVTGKKFPHYPFHKAALIVIRRLKLTWTYKVWFCGVAVAKRRFCYRCFVADGFFVFANAVKKRLNFQLPKLANSLPVPNAMVGFVVPL